MRTVLELVDAVHAASTGTGTDLSIEDVAFIIATFLEGLAAHPGYPRVSTALLDIANEVNRAKDE